MNSTLESHEQGKKYERSCIQLVACASIFLWLIALLYLASVNGSINDEYAAHLTSGWMYWKTGEFSGGVYNPPLGQLFVSSLIALTSNELSPFSELPPLAARIPNLLLGAAFAWFFFNLLVRDFGQKKASIGLGLFLLNPVLISNIIISTIDFFITAILFFTMIALRRYLFRSSLRNCLILSCLSGIALASKVTALVLPICFVTCFVFLPLFSQGRRIFLIRLNRPSRFVMHATFHILLFSVIVWLCIGVSYLFKGIGEYERSSINEPSGLLQETILLAEPLLPQDFIEATLEKIKYAEAGNESYLAGVQTTQGLWWYYPVLLLFKSPVGLSIAILLSVPFVLLSLRSPRSLVIFSFPCVLILLTMISNRTQIGIRHLLPVFPFLIYMIMYIPIKFDRRLIIALTFLFLSHTAVLLNAFPSILTAEAEFIWGKGYRLMTDSNYDWGQENNTLDELSTPTANEYAEETLLVQTREFYIRSNHLNGFNTPYSKSWCWLENVKPRQIYQNVILHFEIGHEELQIIEKSAEDDPWVALSLARFYEKQGDIENVERLSASLRTIDDVYPIYLQLRAHDRALRGEILEAYRDLRTAKNLKPDSGKIRLDFEVMELRAKLERIHEARPQIYQAELLNWYLATRNLDAAKKSVESFEPDKTDMSAIAPSLFWYYYISGDWNEALRICESFKFSTNDIPAAPPELISQFVKGDITINDLESLADLCYKSELWPKAAECYMRLLERDPDHIQAMNRLGQIVVHYKSRSDFFPPTYLHQLRQLSFTVEP